MYFYYRDNGVVAMVSENKIDTELSEYQKIPTNDENNKLKDNWKIKFVDEELVFEEPQHIKEINQPTVEQLKEMVTNAKDISELKDIIKLLIK